MKQTVRIIRMAVISAAVVGAYAADNTTSPLGINLQGVIDWSTELHFINQAKRARPWISQKSGYPWGEGPPLDLDSNGYVRSLESGQSAELFVATPPCYIPGTYTVFFEGEGRLEGVMGASGTVTASGQNVTFKPTGNGYVVLALRETNPADYLRNLEIIPVDMVATYRAGEVFWPDFKQNWAPYRYLRFMDWGHTNNSTLSTWAGRSRVESYTYGTAKGVPYEVMIRLANELNANPWFCVPHAADDDYVRCMAELVRDSLHPGLSVHVEHSNEVWNGVFPGQFNYCVEKGGALKDGGESDFDGLVKYHAVRTAQIAEIWASVLGRERITSVYAVGGPSTFMINKGMGYLQSLGKEGLVDVASIAPYVGADASYSTVDQAIAALNAALPEFEQRVAECKAAAATYGLRLTGYEGGQHLWNFGQDFSSVGEEAQGDPRMYDWVLEYMRLWRENGGDEFMVFASGGGFWGQIPWGTEPMDAPKYKAHYDFIQANPLWWEVPSAITPAGARAPVRATSPEVLFDLRGRVSPYAVYAFPDAPGCYVTPLEFGGARSRMLLRSDP